MNSRIQCFIWTCLALPILISGSPYNSTNVTPVVIDSDGGADDAWGLLLFLWNEANNVDWSGNSSFKSNETFKLVAVTSVAGNTGVQNATRNLQATLEVAERLDIPLYAGATTGLMGNHHSDFWYGYDGFGDFLRPLQKENVVNEAADQLVRLSKEYNGSLVIICIGPLTNIALAQRKDPQFLHRVKKIQIMGGTVFGMGNLKPGVEFNIYQDPEAADVIFRESPRVITVMPYDPIYLNQISKDWRENVLGTLDSTPIKFLNMTERKALQKLSFWASADPQAVATTIWPQLISKNLVTYACVETGGVHARGAMLIDHTPDETGVIPNVNMIQEIHLNNYQQLLLLAFDNYY